MPENQASTPALLVGVARGARAAAAPGRGPAARGDPRRPRSSRASACRRRGCSRRTSASRAAWSATRTCSSPPRAGCSSRRARRRGWRRRVGGRGRRAARARRGGGRRRRGRAKSRGRAHSVWPSPAAACSRRAVSPRLAAPRSRHPVWPRPAVPRSRRRVRYDLRPGRPDLARFPRADWLRSLERGGARRRAWRSSTTRRSPARRGCARCSRPTAAGCAGRSRAADDVILCAGAAQAFVTIAEALGPVRLAVEDPGHEGIRGLFAKRGLEPVPVRVDEAGHRRRRAARRRARGAAHARPPVPDRRRADRRAARRAAALGRRARRADRSRTTTTPSTATTARRSARCRACGPTSSPTSARSPRRSRPRCGSAG